MPNKRKLSLPNGANEVDSYQVRTLQKKRTTNFREDETKLLISLWGSPVIQNKLYLTHRKAPVMRLLAANMQQRGFCRTPDEIKTRIRNLKCLYHRIKRTMVTGSGIGTVDPDWPHFKAMDAILGKEGVNKQEKKPIFQTEDAALEGPRCEDIKQELELDINDDMESWAGNDSVGGSDYEDNHIPTTSIAKPIQESPAPSMAQMSAQLPILPLPAPAPPSSSLASLRPNGAIPLPLLILNHGIQPQPPPPQPPEKKSADSAGGKANETLNDMEGSPSDLVNILREILNVQNQQLELDKQKFELEKQRLEFDRVVGTQLMTLVPMVGGLLQRLVYPPVPTNNHNIDTADSVNNEADSKAYQDKQVPEYDILKDSKILRTVLERGIKKYMMADETRDSNKDNDEDSDNDDSAVNERNNLLIENENSNSNSK